MNRTLSLFAIMALAALASGMARADSRPGSVAWSDGRKETGALSLTPGKGILLFTAAGQAALAWDEIREIRFSPEKEEMAEGFYFPNAGQATQAKTGDVYPVRYLKTEITLADGSVLQGHLFTTTVYVETDEATEKVVLMAKLTGTDGQKLIDIPYPAVIHFDDTPTDAGSSRIDLTSAGLSGLQHFLAISRPDLGLLPAQPMAGGSAWKVPLGDPRRILFSVEASDGVHVAWPDRKPDPAVIQAVNASLKVMQDFYDTRTLLGCFTDVDAGDVYSLVLMERLGKTVGFSASKKPWGIVLLRWKYDPNAHRTTLLNRVNLLTGRVEGNSSLPVVFKQAELLNDISALPAAPSSPPTP